MLNNNKLRTIIMLAACTLILTISAFSFLKIQQNHKANMQLIESCFDNFEHEVVVKKESMLATVSCENES